MDNCLFCKILQREIPAQIAYEDDDIMAFHDIRPQAPVHLLLIPKKHIDSLFTATAQDETILGKLLALAPIIAREHGLIHGFKTAINTGVAGGQEVYHLHVHIYGTPSI